MLLEHANLTKEERKAVAKWQKEQKEGDYEYCDNFRYARLGNEAQEAAYEEAREGGCCGFCDVTLHVKQGVVLLFGFNHGH